MIAGDMLTQAQQRCIPDVSFELIPIRNLVSNQEYQRPLSENHIRKALEEFDVYQINPVKVSRRDGINYVFDGQHTIEIIASESGSRDTPVWCMIYDDLKYKEEAHIFADQQKHVKALSSFETFKAHIEADDPKQKMIEAIVQSYGLAITSTKAKNGISAVSTLERIYDKYGQAVLDNYDLRFRGSGVATVEPKEGACVYGLLWELTDKCEASLDRYEGYPRLYIKQTLEVRTFDGQRVPVMAYIMNPELHLKPSLPPRDYYLGIKAGYEQNGLPVGCLKYAFKNCLKECGIEPYPKKVQTKPPQRKEASHER